MTNRAFSLIEVLIAFAVLFVASIGIYSMLTVGLRATDQSGSMTEAVNFCRHLTELIRVRNLPFTQSSIPPSRQSGLNDRANDRPALDAPPFGVSDFSGLPSTSRYRRNIRISRLSNRSSDFQYELAKIEVAVFWTEKDVEREVRVSTLHRRP